MILADAIFKRLKRETSCIYVVPGGAAMFLVDSLGRSGIQYVSAIHESGAGFMAVGHAMLTNKLAACLVTAGPGSANIITACAAAWMDSLPILFVSGQAKTETLIAGTGLRTRGVQEVNIIPMVTPITKFASQPLTPEACMSDLEYMIETCQEGRKGPCWISIPLDTQSKTL
jgi:acetolactate synthase-1/2/3 large subunit